MVFFFILSKNFTKIHFNSEKIQSKTCSWHTLRLTQEEFIELMSSYLKGNIPILLKLRVKLTILFVSFIVELSTKNAIDFVSMASDNPCC